jgi:hypothetical protein
MAPGRLERAAKQGAKLVVLYGPQAKIIWDRGGKQAAFAAARQAAALNARRKALNHASGVVDGSVLKIAPEGTAVYVVFTGEVPVAAYPAQEKPLADLLAHADLDKRFRPPEQKPSGHRALPRRRDRG